MNHRPIILIPYSQPQQVIYDKGRNLIGFESQELLKSYRIKEHPTPVKNPQANSIIEQLQLTLGDQLRCTTFRGVNSLDNVKIIIQACAYTTQAAVPSNNTYSPAQLTFRMDILFCQYVIINWEKLKLLRQEQAIAINHKGKKRVKHDYHVGDLVLMPQTMQLSSRTEGPHAIT